MDEMIISGSILAADFARLEQEAIRAKNAGVSMLHIDVMDGHFVPNISFGAPILRCLDRVCSLFMDVHLMIENPIDYLSVFKKAGADRITFHVESQSDPAATITQIHQMGLQAGISIKPNTPVEALEPYLSDVELILIMSVEPGFGGQAFMPQALEKIAWVSKNAPQCIVQVDGGINGETGELVYRAGARELVVGSYLFGAKDMQEVVLKLHDACDKK